MNGTSGRGLDGEQVDGDTGIRVRCTADSLDHDLDVSWTRGAIFEFDSLEDAERWLTGQNARVRGTLFLSRVPAGEDALSVDYYVKYTGHDP